MGKQFVNIYRWESRHCTQSYVLCLLCVCVFPFVFLIVLLCFACACLLECGYRYFGDQIGDVFTEEDFQLYRFVHCLTQYILFLMPITYNFRHALFMFMS